MRLWKLMAVFCVPVLLSVGTAVANFGGDRTIATLEITAETDLDKLELPRDTPAVVRELLAGLPEGGKLELETVHVRPLDAHPPFTYLSRITTYNRAGKKDGEEREFQVDGERGLRRVSHYRDGERHGIERMLRDVRVGREMRPVVVLEVPWNAGNIDGVRRIFHHSGDIQTETPYKDGAIHGTSRTYDEDGQIIREVSFEQGRRHGESKDFWLDNPEQVQRIVPYRDGQVHGTARSFYLDGTPQWERPFVDNDLHGVERHFDGTGQEQRVIYWLANERVTRDVYEAAVKR